MSYFSEFRPDQKLSSKLFDDSDNLDEFDDLNDFVLKIEVQ